MSTGPHTTKEKEYYFIDHEDEAVRGMLVLENGKMMWPAPLPPPWRRRATPRRSRWRSGRRRRRGRDGQWEDAGFRHSDCGDAIEEGAGAEMEEVRCGGIGVGSY